MKITVRMMQEIISHEAIICVRQEESTRLVLKSNHD